MLFPLYKKGPAPLRSEARVFYIGFCMFLLIYCHLELFDPGPFFFLFCI